MIARLCAAALGCALILADPLARGQGTTAATHDNAGAVTIAKIAVSGGPGKGFTVATTDDRFAATVRARAQIREPLTAAPALTNELNVKTLRLYLQGHVLSPQLKYLVQLALDYVYLYGNDIAHGRHIARLQPDATF